uniref:Phosphoprotein n=1 Tax=Niviventer confucianus morbillivirus TaxID=3049976 RepID=A0A9Y1Z4E2_9MONO|nr:phosphoprotein [Niviventer confucianus morbillivirus]
MDDINHTTIQNALATLKNLREDPPSSEELSSCRELLRETKSEPGKPIGYQYFRNPEYVEPDSISEKPNNNGILDGNLSTGRYASVPGQGEPGSNKTREDLGAASIRYPTIPTDDSEQADTEDAANSTLGSVGDAGGVSDSGGAAPLSASTPIASDDDATGSLASGNTPSRRSSSLARQSIEPIKEEDFAMVGLRTGTKPKAARKRLPLPASNSSSPQTQPAQSIKKGTGENMTLYGTMMGFSYTAGAIQSVPRSDLYPSGKDVPVENALTNAPTAKEILHTSLTQISEQGEDELDVEEKSFHEITNAANDTHTLNQLLDNQKLIISKLDQVLALKNDIDSIKKQLTKQSLAISTLEGHLSSIMIAVPGHGRPYSSVEENPDLKPVLGRDGGRGIPEVSTTKSIDLDKGLSSKMTVTINREQYLDPLNDNKTNATRFMPTYGGKSREVIRSIIRASKLSSGTKLEMLRALDNVKNDEEVSQFYDILIKYLEDNKMN